MSGQLRPLLAAVVAVGFGMTACSLDAATLSRPGAGQVRAEVDELRVLGYDDDPAVNRWMDAVTPDPAVFEEGTAFREADSRTAADHEPAEQRRLFTAVAPGRTLLVVVDCDPCTDAGPDAALAVWDLVVGEPDQDLSLGTAVARPGARWDTTVGELVVLARTEGGPTTGVDVTGDGTVRLVGSHGPDDGTGVWLALYLATGPGPVTIAQQTAGETYTFPLEIA